jgi:hypothetical protein
LFESEDEFCSEIEFNKLTVDNVAADVEGNFINWALNGSFVAFVCKLVALVD